MRIIYSFNKRGFEADFWTREIAGASNERHEFIPFNHDPYLNVNRYSRAQLLDNLYYEREPGLMKMYEDINALIADSGAQAMIVDNGFPYHPEFLRTLPIFKVLRTSDGPVAAYDRDFAYVHAYDQILHHSPAYSRDLDMNSKLRYVGAKDARLWLHCLFDRMFDQTKTEQTILAGERDIDVLFVGAPFPNKMPLLARVKKAFGKRAMIRGISNPKWNIYYNVKFGMPGWIRPIAFEEYVPLYHRTKIGFNVHNRGDYTIGGYRLFELPGNGVMQISDGGPYLDTYFEVGTEIVRHTGADDLIDKIRYYLDHEEERKAIALAGYRRVMRDHRAAHRFQQGAEMIADGIRQKQLRESALTPA
jgi:hypothetical protein